MVEKYSQRRPSLATHPVQRPSTPSSRADRISPSPNRNRSPLASPSRLSSAIGPSSLGLEGLLSDAARAAYTRGEKWGLNRAVRDAVGEVRKNVSAIGTSPRNSLHRRTSSADLVRKYERLEQRSKALSQMLEGALNELWECQRMFAEEGSGKETAEDEGELREKSENETTESTKSTRKGAVDALGMAIAKVQFVQVYLGDTTMPLAIDDTSTSHRPQEHRASSDSTERSYNATGIDVEKTLSIEAALADAIAEKKEDVPQTPRSTQPRHKPHPDAEVLFDASEDTESTESSQKELTAPGSSKSTSEATPQARRKSSTAAPQPRTIPAKSTPTITTTPAIATSPSDKSSSPPPRPSLDQSSFSWMLGYTGPDRHHAFAAALSSPFGSEDSSSTGARRTADKGKAFLFGEEDEDGQSESQSSVGERRDSMSRGRGKRRAGVLRKKPPSAVGGGSKTDGKKGDGTADEDINLSALSTS